MCGLDIVLSPVEVLVVGGFMVTFYHFCGVLGSALCVVGVWVGDIVCGLVTGKACKCLILWEKKNGVCVLWPCVHFPRVS